MRKMISLLLMLGLTITLVSCGGNAREGSEETTQTEISSSAGEEVSMGNIEWCYAHDFHEGRAWIEFFCDDKYYSGVIDKEGNMLFRVERNSQDVERPIEITDYSNGYAVVTKPDKVDVLNLDGTVVSSHTLNDTTKVKACGDGYVLIEEHYSDFDSNGYIYTIYSPQGEALKTIEAEEESTFTRYLGKGVFLCNGYMHFLSSGKEIPFNGDGHNVHFYEDMAPIGIEYADFDKDGYRGVLVFTDATGEIGNIKLYPEYGWDWDEDTLAIKNNKLVLYDFGAGLSTYNFEDGSFVSMSEDSAGKVVWGDIVSPLYFDDSERIALTLQGSDGNYYVALFDSAWNMVTEPIQVRSNQNFVRGYGYADSGYVLSEGRFIVSTVGISENPKTFVYDENENLIYELYEKGFCGISPYSDGVACVSSWEYYKKTGYSVNLVMDGFMDLSSDESPKYLDLEGNLLFEEINMAHVFDI